MYTFVAWSNTSEVPARSIIEKTIADVSKRWKEGGKKVELTL